MTACGGGWAHVVVRRGDPPRDAHRLLRELVASRTGSDPREVMLVHHCARCGSSRHGRPLAVVPSVPLAMAVSITRTSGMVGVAATDRSRIGLDLELASDPRLVEIAPVALHPDEQVMSTRTLARSWVRKEAVTKCVGLGLDVAFSQICLIDAPQGPAVVGWPEKVGPVPELWIRDLDTEGYAGAVAVDGTDEPDLTLDLG